MTTHIDALAPDHIDAGITRISEYHCELVEWIHMSRKWGIDKCKVTCYNCTN